MASVDKNIGFDATLKIIKSKISVYHPRAFQKEGSLPAAVLILFMNKNGKPYILFTRRTDTVETHKGQISFPGGMKADADQTLMQTALRETEEEVGISPGQIEVIGGLDAFFTVTNFLVTPFVGYLKGQPDYTPNDSEVAEILEAPLALFLGSENFEIKKWEHQGVKYDVFFYYHDGNTIWGATAFMLNQFIDRVFGFNPAPKSVTSDPRNRHYLQENRSRGSKPEN